MNISEAADALGISPRTVMRRIKAGRLRARRDGRRVVIEPKEIKRYKREECELLGMPVHHNIALVMAELPEYAHLSGLEAQEGKRQKRVRRRRKQPGQ